MPDPLTLLTNDIVQDIIKNLRPADLARLGMVDTRLRDISTVQMAEILASPTLTNVAQRWRSKLMRPLIHFSTAADLPPEGAGPRKGTDWHLMRPQYMQRGAGGIQINWPDLDDDDNQTRSLADLNDDEYDLVRKRNHYGHAWINGLGMILPSLTNTAEPVLAVRFFRRRWALPTSPCFKRSSMRSSATKR